MLFSVADQANFWLEPAASTGAHTHDWVFNILFYTTSFFFFLVMGLMVAFVIIYRRRPGPLPVGGPTHNAPLEIFWTAVPLIVVCGFFVVGLYGYVEFESPAPANSDVVEVTAKQWSFSFAYPNGAVSDVLYVQKDRPTSLQLQSADVTHAVYIPAFRVQRNAVPGRTTYIWFTPTLPGTYNLFCTQYCGDGHGAMNTSCVVLEADKYSAKMIELANIFNDPQTKQPLPYAKVGEKLYRTSGCTGCHTVDGTPKVGGGPTWKGLFKSNVAFDVAPQGYSLTTRDSDEKWTEYIRESILKPDAKIVKGFPNIMPPQAAQFGGPPNSLKDKKLQALVEYIKSLDSSGPPQQFYKPMPIPKDVKADKEKADKEKAAVLPAKPAAADSSAAPSQSVLGKSIPSKPTVEKPAAKSKAEGN